MEKRRSLNSVYLGMLSKNGYFESYTEGQVKDLGGDSKRAGSDRYLYHHQRVFNALSPLKDWMDVYAKDSTVRFTRRGRCGTSVTNGDNFELWEEAAMRPFKKKNKEQLSQLAKKLIELGVDGRVEFQGAFLRLPEEVATHRGKVIGSLEELAK